MRLRIDGNLVVVAACQIDAYTVDGTTPERAPDFLE